MIPLSARKRQRESPDQQERRNPTPVELAIAPVFLRCHWRPSHFLRTVPVSVAEWPPAAAAEQPPINTTGDADNNEKDSDEVTDREGRAGGVRIW